LAIPGDASDRFTGGQAAFLHRLIPLRWFQSLPPASLSFFVLRPQKAGNPRRLK
jgi:hypothetical protein